MKHFHYTVQGYNEINEKGWLMDGAAVEIEDPSSEEDALNQAKSLIKRKLYKVTEIRECGVCARNKEIHSLNKKQIETAIELQKSQRLLYFKQNELLDKSNDKLDSEDD